MPDGSAHPDPVAVIRSIPGMQARVAKACNISKQAVGQWRHVPIKHIRAVEAETGIPREMLAPELYRLRGAK